MVMKTNLIVNLLDGLKPCIQNSKHSLKPDLQSAVVNKLKDHFMS